LKVGQKVGGWLKKGPKGVSEIGSGKAGEKKLARVQADGDGDEGRDKEAKERRDYVKRAFMHAWSGYAKNAWGHDEVSPVSRLWSNNYNGASCFLSFVFSER
jgi:mannosyl-oligosaccharide alpha-1,2-mannosidase